MTQQLHDKFVVMAGVPKCGSTSLFEWLNDHPQIAGSHRKQPNFFWSPPGKPGTDGLPDGPDYLPMWERGYHNKPLHDYYKAFPAVADGDVYRFDGSISYWTTPQSAELIHRHLPNARLIFVFRNPVERFISWYKYLAQLHVIPPKTTLDQVIEGLPSVQWRIDMAFSLGKYAERLKPYWDLFDPEDILLLRFKDLRGDPAALMKRICRFLEIDGDMYDQYEFTRRNSSRMPKSKVLDHLQYRVIMGARSRILRFPRLFRVVSAVNRKTWSPLYYRLNSRVADKKEVSARAVEVLNEYYRDESRLLQELTGVDGLLER